MKEFSLPDLGEGLMEAEIVAWHVNEGDNVVTDQPLLSVETDKAVVEVPSPWSGKISKLHAEPGDVVEVDAVLVSFDQDEKKDAGAVVGDVQPKGEVVTEEAIVEAAATDPRKAGKATPAVRALAQKLGVIFGIRQQDSVVKLYVRQLVTTSQRFYPVEIPWTNQSTFNDVSEK